MWGGRVLGPTTTHTMGERGRYRGTGQELCEIMLPFATNKSFVKFDESSETPKIDKYDMKAVIKDHEGLLGAIYAVQPNLAIPTKTMTNALTLVLHMRAVQWDLDQKFHKDWLATIGLRIKNLLRVVAQGVIKKRAWAESLPWMAGGLSSQPQQPPAHDKEYFFAFDTELKKAVRCPVGDPTQKEPNQYFKEPPQADPDDAMIAVWPDGMTRLG